MYLYTSFKLTLRKDFVQVDLTVLKNKNQYHEYITLERQKWSGWDTLDLIFSIFCIFVFFY